MSSRGVYRGIFSALPDDPDFQTLTPDARLLFYTARICHAAGPACIFRYYPAVLMAQSGLDAPRLEAALEELQEARWIEREGVILWIRNGLRYDPHMRVSDGKHRLSIERAVLALPKLPIVLRFCAYYHLPRPFEDPTQDPTQDPSKTNPTGEGEGVRIREGERVREGLREREVSEPVLLTGIQRNGTGHDRLVEATMTREGMTREQAEAYLTNGG